MRFTKSIKSNRHVSHAAKYFLTKLGGLLSEHHIYLVTAALNYLTVGNWMRKHDYDTRHRFATREELFSLVGAEVGDRNVLYLEFGVFTGAATRYWSKLLRNPNSKLHGFDSFEGLPEPWLPSRPKGHFSLDGMIPCIDDSRIRWYKGWFEDTLPKYQCPAHDVLVINVDADLYSSARCVLANLRDKIVPGTFVYFDEFNHCSHELRAFDEFMNSTGMRFALCGVTRTLEHAVFRRTD